MHEQTVKAVEIADQSETANQPRVTHKFPAAGSRVFLTWLPYSQRSQTLAECFGARPVYFGYLAGGKSALKAILRYILMTFHTVGFLLKERPKLVFVMNQPVFLPLTVHLLSFLGYRYVIDSHSGLFNKREWRWALPLMKYAYRRSLFSIVTNREHQELVASWGTRVEVLGALKLAQEKADRFVRPATPCLVVIGTFAADEPTAEILEACRRLPDVQFFVTGSLKHAPPALIRSAPPNVAFTDFMPRSKYVGLVQAMDGAMILVTKDNVMQRGAYEAMSWAVPIITSDWRLLRETFHRGALFVDNSPEQIVSAVTRLLDNLHHYRAEIDALRADRTERWTGEIARINAFLDARGV